MGIEVPHTFSQLQQRPPHADVSRFAMWLHAKQKTHGDPRFDAELYEKRIVETIVRYNFPGQVCMEDICHLRVRATQALGSTRYQLWKESWQVRIRRCSHWCPYIVRLLRSEVQTKVSGVEQRPACGDGFVRSRTARSCRLPQAARLLSEKETITSLPYGLTTSGRNRFQRKRQERYATLTTLFSGLFATQNRSTPFLSVYTICQVCLIFSDLIFTGSFASCSGSNSFCSPFNRQALTWFISYNTV